MKIASITEAENNLSALIDGLKAGSPVLIVDHGRPVARLEPITGGRDDAQGRLSRLVREGVVRLPLSEPPLAVFNTPPPEQAGVSALGALLGERRDGR
jgi:prevent-host-death family protein